ncbi:MAG: hypothetical protein JNK49_01420 [Planctomycetes bacterium]|nr:hypothetical protein [Planctomycetota bacterium]
MRSPTLLFAAGTGLALAAAAFAGTRLLRLETTVDRMATQLEQRQTQLDAILDEVTRLRLEQSTGQQGPKGLLTRLATYAPLVSDARTTEPDYQNARKEITATVRALGAIGETAWQPVQNRLRELNPQQHFDELRWLLEAALVIDPERAKSQLKDVLLGLQFPSPRLRWYAARRMVELDRPLAQATLRQILTTESSRGPDLDRAKAYGLTVPDRAAYATTGFDAFVGHYVASEDPEVESTLLMVLQRTEHDTMTLMACVEELGRRRCRTAAEPIQRLFREPPSGGSNPLFLVKCLDALDAILGKEARSFFEQALTDSSTPHVTNHLKHLLGKS